MASSPPPPELLNQESTYQQRQQGPIRSVDAMARASASTPQRLRNECESWVEISSQPSSSSLSSIGDEIVLTGLRVQHDSNAHRRRGAKRPRNNNSSHLPQQTRQFSHSSQEEYDESESEEDHVMTSSNENLSARSSRPAQLSAQQQTYHTSDDDDENGTTLGIGRARTRGSNASEHIFTPQPNAFSHPPSSQPGAGSHFPRTSAPPPQNHRHSYSGRSATTRQQHTPFSGTSFSPASQDHDAALRASLTTLLSCAAAARGLPKRNHSSPNQQPWGIPHPGQTVGQEPSGNISGMRLVPESELLEEEGTRTKTSHPSSRGRASPIRTQSSELEKGKRKTQINNLNTKDKERERVTKKKRSNNTDEIGYFTFGLGYGVISPTFLTWVVSAGVVVLVGVVGFGAGYAMGREAGFQEGSFIGAGGMGGGSCGKEVVRSGGGGLRKIRMAITA